MNAPLNHDLLSIADELVGVGIASDAAMRAAPKIAEWHDPRSLTMRVHEVAAGRSTYSTEPRRYTVEPTESCWHGRGFRARLRKYGDGCGVGGTGVPNYFGSIAAAEAAGTVWVETGK